ncbi:hypothetical protein CO671_01795 [Rhizobium sp. M10]|uniref:hypothetical protein n=1 Tax=Rhizobium sp. M10 TaxID=1324586 RepID=UPI000BE7FA91|nr:hypothetical protein [Rhizobium sp. M10]PDT38155.1 hypothetical protein CO671_01795 [Rhizobium sp. M10]
MRKYITIDHDTSDTMPAVHTSTGLPSLMPNILQRLLPNPRRPLSAETVHRILTRLINNHHHSYERLLDVYKPKIIMWGTLEDGTTVAILEDSGTGIRHMWSLDRMTFRPVSYGKVDA